MRHLTIVLSIAGAGLAPAHAFAQSPPDAGVPAQSSLVVGALQIGAHAGLEIAGFDINVARDRVVYSYFLKNAGPAELAVTAAISLPELRPSSETRALASGDPENPIGLAITVAGASVTTTPEIHATALGLDRLTEIKAEHMPLIPFGPATDKALAALSPDAVDRLAGLGVVSPRDPAQPKTPPFADWSLDVVQGWRLVLPPGKMTPVIVRFAPIRAQYRLAKGDERDIEDMKDDLCLTPTALNALQARLKSGGAWTVSEIVVAVDAPTRWLDSPGATLSAKKPRPEAIVAFCGADEKTAGKPIVLGAAPDDLENGELRIAIFEPAAK